MQTCLNVQTVSEDYFNCIDAMMATIATHYGRDYQMMFLGSWGFFYNLSAENFSLRIRFGVDRYSRETLAQYHGVVSQWNIVKGVPGLVERARRHLDAGNPMGLYMNAYYCPWSSAYRRFSINHYGIIVGMDERRKEFFCVDPYSFSQEVYTLPFDSLRKGFQEVIEFHTVPQPPLLPLKTLLLQNGFCQGGKERFDRQCGDIRRLADDLPGDLDLAREIAGFQEDLKNSLIFRQVSNVSKHRAKTAVGFRYMADKYGQPELETFAGALDKAAGEWNRVNTLLYKLHFTKKDEIKQRISRLIYGIADLEAQTADELIRFSESL